MFFQPVVLARCIEKVAFSMVGMIKVLVFNHESLDTSYSKSSIIKNE